jgi:transposase
MSEVEATTASTHARVLELEAALARVTQERDLLRGSHDRLRLELEMLKRRLFVAKAERIDTAQLEMEFAEKLRQLDALAGFPGEDDDGAPPPGDKKKKAKSTGRRDLKKLSLDEERVEIADPLYEKLVADGKAARIGFEESCKLGWKRGGMRRVVVARVKYEVTAPGSGHATVDTAPVPPELFPRSLCAPSLLAHIIMQKYGQGMPLFRIEDAFARDGCPVDRGTMCRWVEDAGATCGATVVHAARQDALSAFCIATDATGVAVQPIRTHEKVRKPCKRGHYFVHIADRDHVFFEYTAKENSDAVRAMFKGYSGYVQADAKSVYDVLFREHADDATDDEDDGALRFEVGCFAHCRRKFWEAATAKSVVGREGLARLGRIFELDASWRDKPPDQIKRLRDAHLRPHLDAFFAWATLEYDKVRDQRGILRSALGYAVRQKDALLRVLDDGRLVLDNNRSERALRSIAVGRKAWLFVGSDDHAESAGHLFSLIASCKLHRLDPEAYLRDLLRVLAHWPKDRYLELAPKFWADTRARLDPSELANEIGPLAVPPPAQQ